MGKKTWTEAEEKLLAEKYPVSTKAELKILFPNKTDTAIKSKAKTMGLKISEETMHRIRRTYNQNWTLEMEMFIVENYKQLTRIEIAQKLKLPRTMVRNRIRKLGLKKGTNIGWYKKGQEAFNKGKKWDEFMSEEGQKNCLKTCYKKGHSPHNHKNIGSVRMQADGYYYIKVSEPRKWEQLHHVIYKQHNPDYIQQRDDILEFADGNRANLHIDNIILSTRQESIKRAALSDNNIVRFITNDKKLQKSILENNPEIIELKRNILKANKTLKNLQNGKRKN